jgi:hypothetical protein
MREEEMPMGTILYKQEVIMPIKKKDRVEEETVGVTVFIIWRGKRNHLEQPPRLRRYELGARLKQGFNKLYLE